ncbi:MAG: alpha-E domain-containing protein [Pseudomonadota bacterium]|nr:alpha-E domain-containing protein [Pseudomonadota bacterium]
MLSRSAENLFWLARYMERAEATARLIEMGRRMAMLPGPAGRDEWRSVARAGASGGFIAADEPAFEGNVVSLLLLREDNPSSIRSSFSRARFNARAVRTALTQQMWETLNDGWRRLEGVDEDEARRDLVGILDWVKTRAATFRGAADSSMLRDDRYDFLRLGGLIERADATLRLLDVKYYVLLPEADVIGGGRDHHQWTSVLFALNGLRAFHHAYKGDFSPWKIADFLILNRDFPRSLAFCYSQIVEHLNNLSVRYGDHHRCSKTSWDALVRLSRTGAGEIFRNGLHEFVNDAIVVNNRLAAEISEAYYF